MANDWIKMRTALWDHPKVVRIVSAICPAGARDLAARCRVIGALYRTWALADTHTEDGVLDGYDADALDAVVGIEGWALNLQHVGWLIVEPQRLIVPRFTDHNGDSSKRRAEDALRKKIVRKMSGEKRTRVRKTSTECPPREEKIREDKNKSDSPPENHSSEPPKARKPKAIFAESEIPESLRTSDFVDAWQLWFRSRAENGKPLTPLAVKEQLAKLSNWGPTRAAAAIKFSIASQYQGIYEDKNHVGQTRQGVQRAGPGQRYDPTTAGAPAEF